MQSSQISIRFLNRQQFTAITSALMGIAILAMTMGASSSALAESEKKKTSKAAPATLPKRKAGVQPPAAAAAVPQTATISGDDDEAETARRVPLNANSAIKLNYGRNDWNKSSTKVDAAVIYLREGATGRIVQVEVEETAPDSAVFSGIYSINWRNIDALKVEFYAPPPSLLADLSGRKQISKMIETGDLKRLPFVMRKDAVTNVQNIELFDNADQARLAYRAFQSEQQLLIALQNRMAARDQTLDTAKLAMEKAELEEASRNLAERVRLSQVETQKLQQLLQAFGALPPDERERRKKSAQSIADQALIDYRAGRFQQAKASFEKAVELDPSNRNYYFQYGVTLYKLDDFNRSLVYLDLAEGKSVNNVERDFYRGLCFYRLKDSVSALDAFTKVVSAKDPQISPSARFYKGLIYFERKRWDEARTEFQGVLDDSSDPALDERSEAFIEQILRMQQFEAERAKKWQLSATLGGIYDDNVLLSSDSDRDRGTATNSAAYRALIQGSARYRPIYEATSEFAAQLDVLTMTSVDKDFAYSQTITNTDPTVVGLTLPWTHKGLLMGKGHKFDFVPGYEMTFMSAEANTWKPIFNSFTGSFLNLIVLSETWFTNLNLDLRQDNSTLDSSTGDDNGTAMKAKITWSNIHFPFEDKKQLVTSELAFTQNAALGKNSKFDRVDLGVGYIRPAFWDTTFNSKLGYFTLNYPENSTGRIDNSVSVMMGLSRKVTEKVTSGLTGIYNYNGSNVTANQYKKLTFMFTMSIADAF